MPAINLLSNESLGIESAVTEEWHYDDCIISLRRIEGINAKELYLCCKPLPTLDTAEAQTNAMYSRVIELLKEEGGSLDSLISETIFLRDMKRDINAVRQAMHSLTQANTATAFQPARTEIEQPPLEKHARLEIAVQAIIPHAVSVSKEQVCASTNCVCGECDHFRALRVEMGDDTFLHAGGLCGDGKNAYEQTQSLFLLAEELLHRAGMEFKDVARTWIYLRHMERDYPELNRARREFFDSRGINPVPASTGIEGGMVNEKHDLCIGFYAIKSGRTLVREVMQSPTLNEAGEYGADFVRGMKVVEENKTALHVSGTASIDEQGKTAHIGDASLQIDRMILNIRELLAQQGASFRDIAYAYNYLKNPEDEQLLRDKFKEAGLEGFPSVFVNVEVCRPNLLCETEVLAVLPNENHVPHSQRYLKVADSAECMKS